LDATNQLADCVRKDHGRNCRCEHQQCGDRDRSSHEATGPSFCRQRNTRPERDPVSIGQGASALNLLQGLTDHLGHHEQVLWTLIGVAMQQLA
jgi:hypothetical protein